MVKKKKKKGPTDEQLFGDTDHIFGDVPEAKPKAVKTKKKKKKPSGEGAVEGDSATAAGGGELCVCVQCVIPL